MSETVQCRAGETDHHPFRTDRFYNADSAWYFMIRGGASRGPYDSRTEAEEGLKDYIKTQAKLNQVFHSTPDAKH